MPFQKALYERGNQKPFKDNQKVCEWNIEKIQLYKPMGHCVLMLYNNCTDFIEVPIEVTKLCEIIQVLFDYTDSSWHPECKSAEKSPPVVMPHFALL